ncbi:MAG: hypothetical protein HY978_03645 [Candidatus Liptonbacteria bacterium]|nr:hypothetical protein [Candidatus Liptonbacteria bacterium]
MTLTRAQKVFLLLLLGIFFVFSFNQIRDFDTFYHLSAGRLMVETRSVPTTDSFTFTNPGGRWISHEWLIQILFYLVIVAFGPWGLITGIALLGTLTYYLVFLLARRWGAHPYWALAVLFPVAYLTLEQWVVRPQVLSYFLLAAAVLLLDSYWRWPKTAYLVGLVFLIWFWANAHASVLLGLAAICWYGLADILKSKLRRWGAPALSTRERRRFIYAGLAALVFAFLNPNTYQSVFYYYFIRDTHALLNVAEWRSLLDFLAIPQAKLFLALMTAVDLLLVFKFLHDRKPHLTRTGLVLGVSLMPLLAIRHVGYFPLVAAPLLATELSQSGVFAKLAARLNARAFRRIGVAAAAILGIALLSRGLLAWPREPVGTHILATQAVDFLGQTGIAGPGFNFAHDGGYLEWRLYPKYKVFLDGRAETSAGRPAQDFLTIAQMRPGWEQLAFDHYRLNYFLLWYRQPLDGVVAPLQRALIEKHNFRLVYWDDAAILLVRNTPENRVVIDQYGIKIVNPFLDPTSIPEDKQTEAEKEMRSLLARSPDSAMLRAYAELLRTAN